MSSLRPGLFLLMLGMVALVIIGCSGGDDEEPTPNPTTPPEATSAPQPTATSKPSVPGDSGTTEDGAGTLEVRVTDAPDPSITAVYVTTSNIEVSIAGDEGGWETVIDEEITFELLALEGVEAVLGTAELPTGRYTQIHLDVPEVEIVQNGEIVIAEVPSDTIKLVGTF
ncbi:MAG: DUF4382 domain-containing protein [Boseongicola sp.]|nr:DUF4382 domain-containing protein [Boseongicola sp.]